MVLLWIVGFLGLSLAGWAQEFEGMNVSEILPFNAAAFVASPPHMVPLTLITSAAAKGAVCTDGSLPGYHLDRGFGSGINSWLVNLEGGGWCNNIRTCIFRKTTSRGSSNYMEREIPFTGILSNRAEENPDFFNWNRVKVRYCDGASFLGESHNRAAGLFFRGQRIWLAAMDDLMSKGMRYAKQALLSGCSAGGLATIQHCDGFRAYFPRSTKVKCFADAGMFLDVPDVAGGRTLRSLFGGVVSLQGVAKSLPRTCTSHMDPTLCFFPQNILGHIRTPLFLLNSAYDVWQLQQSLAPDAADPRGYWHACKLNHSLCDAYQIRFLQRFRNQMLNAVSRGSISRQNGIFINSCFAHCQSERQDTWYSYNSPLIGNKGIGISVGDWYFERSEVKGIAKSVGNWYFNRWQTMAIDCPYPCDKTCHNLVFKKH